MKVLTTILLFKTTIPLYVLQYYLQFVLNQHFCQFSSLTLGIPSDLIFLCIFPWKTFFFALEIYKHCATFPQPLN